MPYVVGIRDDHLLAGNRDEIYLKQLKGAVGERYSVLHIGEPLVDPDGGGKLGFLAKYSGTARVQRIGAEASATLTEVTREVMRGDVLANDLAQDPESIVPRVPTTAVNGRIVAVVDGVTMASQYQVIAINRGANHGVQVGAVLRTKEAAERTKDTCAHINGRATCNRLRKAVLPGEESGTVLVFKAYPRMSYALLVKESTAVRVGDRVINP
jgi:hypothetical protein